MYTRKDSWRSPYTNDEIVQVCESEGYQVIDIYPGKASTRVTFYDTQGYDYDVPFSSVLEGRTPTFKVTSNNIAVVCAHHGVTLIQEATERLPMIDFKITYSFKGVKYTQNFYTFKARGPVQLKSSILDVREHAKRLRLPIIEESPSLVSYSCPCGARFEATLTQFMSRKTNKCTRCLPGKGLVYSKDSDIQGKGILYVVGLSKGTEVFYKIGISKFDVLKRFQNTRAYEMTPIQVWPMPLSEAYAIEQECLEVFSYSTYQPSEKFSGHTECFAGTPTEMVDYINAAINNVN